jgi:myosin-5
LILAKKYEDDYIYGFWISNTMELISVIRSFHQFKNDREDNRSVRKTTSFAAGMSARLSMAASTRVNGGDIDSAMDQVIANLEDLMYKLYDSWVKNIKKRVRIMCVPAILDHQSLTDYKEKEDTSTWGYVSGMMKYTYSIQELIEYLKPISTTMVAYFMEESIQRQLWTEIVRCIGATCFDTLVTSKNYCTFNRGILIFMLGNQILYNTGVLEEWCTARGVPEAAFQLQHLISAASLLICNKDSPSDIVEIQEKCSLNDVQIHAILSLFTSNDPDFHLSPDLLEIVSKTAKLAAKSDKLLLSDYPIEFKLPKAVAVSAIEEYIPNYLSVPCIQAVRSTVEIDGSR